MHIVDKKLAYIIQLRLGMELIFLCSSIHAQTNVLLCTDITDPTLTFKWLVVEAVASAEITD